MIVLCARHDPHFYDIDWSFAIPGYEWDRQEVGGRKREGRRKRRGKDREAVKTR